MSDDDIPNRKVAWEISNEWYSRVHTLHLVILDKIKREALLWVITGVKKLGENIPGE